MAYDSEILDGSNQNYETKSTFLAFPPAVPTKMMGPRALLQCFCPRSEARS